MTFAIDAAEKIETIVNSYLRNRTASGVFGKIEDIGNNWFGITCDGVYARVSRGPLHWHVLIPSKAVRGCDADLLTAAQMALEA